MKTTIKVINENGIQQIKKFLGENHKKGERHFDRAMLNAWAAEAEASLAEDGNAMIELKSWDSVHGRTQTFTVSDEGVKTYEVDDGSGEEEPCNT
jgi:hypothetical protein